MDTKNTGIVQKIRVLFVEGNDPLRAALPALLHERSSKWEATAVPTVAEALKALAARPHEAIVANVKLPDGNGVELLNKAGQQFPGVARVLRCGPEDKALLRGFVGLPPLRVTKERKAAELETTLACALLVNTWTQEESLKKLLPSSNSSLDDVGKLIARDPALTARMLQMVNSPAMGLASPVAGAVEAVLHLGVERVRAMILIANASLQFNADQCKGFSQESLWQHSIATATVAHAITLEETHDAALAGQAFSAGILHDVGKLLFAANLTEDYGRTISTATQQKLTAWEAERLAFGASHAELGACLLGTWGLPLGVLRAIAWHHTPGLSDDGAFSILTAVHAANALAHGGQDKSTDADDSLRLDRNYLKRLGLTERWTRWRTIAEQAVQAAA
jgi:HD-like signal output (HDOD) protein/CheY-like chemotaxis protein